MRDEVDLIGVAVRHHLSSFCDTVHVVDNGSTDGTAALLHRLARDERVTWNRETGPYRQEDVFTEHLELAARRGVDWLVIFDADEFWWCQGDPRSELAGCADVTTLVAESVTFVQRRDVRRNSLRSLSTMTHRPSAPIGPEDGTSSMRCPVEERRVAYVEMAYPPKLIHRPVAGARIRRGNHGIDGDVTKVQTDAFKCLHAPLRSYEILERKAARAPRHRAPHLPRASWHIARWHRLLEAGELEEEWEANSHRAGKICVGGVERGLVEDPLLVELVGPWLPGPLHDACLRLLPKSLRGRMLGS